ncbi:NAD-dependent epimerase/dehydratase family protein [Nonomuraea sp. NPDC049400]|uniref:NAD-dependent epimerase/dehydratase family protein n=1 Tax=Nonomuraea sp. NPDC049400 TaxID=3364352 RepID=UPI003799BE30
MTAYRRLVVVLGATGLIGSQVAALLADRDIRLRLVASREPPRLTGRAETETAAADLTAPDQVASAVAGADAVFHLVARHDGARAWRVAEGDDAGERVNVGILVDVLAAIRRARPVVVFAGSTSQSGTVGRIDGTEPDRPASLYDRQKLAAETALMRATSDGLVRGVSVRLPTVYGCRPDGAERGVVSAMVRRALTGEPLQMWGDGRMKRDLLHARDAAGALVAALDHAGTLAGRHWVVGTGRPVPVATLFGLVARTVGEHTGRSPVPLRSVPPPAHATSGDLLDVEIDASRFTAVTGWSPRVELDEGLAETVANALRPSLAPRCTSTR